MLTVIMGYGGRIRHVERKKVLFRNLDHHAKLMYILHRSQEIYCMGEGVNHWSKPIFTMMVAGQEMHPKSVLWTRCKDEDVPKEIRMRHLMGSL